MVFIVYISNLHIGALTFKKKLINKVINDINDIINIIIINFDIYIITGNITENRYYQEFIKAVSYLK